MAEGGLPNVKLTRVQWSSCDCPREIFEKAADNLPTLIPKLDSAQLLFLYARYKQANEGSCNIPKPGFFDYQGKQKWNAWKELGDMPKDDAMWQYIEKILEFCQDWNPLETGNDSSYVPNKKSVGPVMSVMVNSDIYLEDSEKSAFDFVKDNNINSLKSLLTTEKSFKLEEKDDEGLTLLHWASDRGHSAIVSWLLAQDVDINVLDFEGQTPLHYASSCGHCEIIEILLKNGAKTDIKDNDGQFPKDISLNDSVARLFIN